MHERSQTCLVDCRISFAVSSVTVPSREGNAALILLGEQCTPRLFRMPLYSESAVTCMDVFGMQDADVPTEMKGVVQYAGGLC